MEAKPQLMTLQEVRQKIDSSSGRIDFFAYVSTEEASVDDIWNLTKEIHVQGLVCLLEKGQEELRIWKWVIFKEIPHHLHIREISREVRDFMQM